MLPLDYIFQPSHFFHVQYFLIQSNLPYATTQNAKPEGSLTRIEPQGASSEKRSRHIYFMEDNVLDAMYNICTSMLPLKFFVYSK